MESLAGGAVTTGATPARSIRPSALAVRSVALWLAANVEELICAVLLVVMVGSVSAAVFFRYVLDSALPWPEEISRFALVWLTFIGAALAAKRQSHVLVDFFVSFLPERARCALAVLVNVVLLLFLVLFFALSVQFVQKASVAVSPALSIRMSYVYFALPLASVLMIVHIGRQTLGLARQLAGSRRG